jgi:hypothetical protein
MTIAGLGMGSSFFLFRPCRGGGGGGGGGEREKCNLAYYEYSGVAMLLATLIELLNMSCLMLFL